MVGILGFIFVIVAPLFVYRSARQNGHNTIFWTLLAFGVGIGLQIIMPLLIGIVLSVIWMSQGRSAAEIEQSLQTPAMIIGLISLALSVGGILLIMRRVNNVRDTDESYLPPPSPPNFN
jgi:uncharacterized oligopeptide transporter (OPT) family protein